MSTEWTAERLDALPEGTVIEWLVPGGKPLRYFVKDLGVTDPDRPWVYTKGGAESSLDLLRMVALKESIRVVSVPIDALLADEAVEQGLWAWVTSAAVGATRENVNPRVLDLNRHRAGAAIRAAVEHVTGEAL